MQSSINNIQQAEHLGEALTGPLIRGDIKTIESHLHVISQPEMQAFYRAAAQTLLPLTGLSETATSQILKLLEE